MIFKRPVLVEEGGPLYTTNIFYIRKKYYIYILEDTILYILSKYYFPMALPPRMNFDFEKKKNFSFGEKKQKTNICLYYNPIRHFGFVLMTFCTTTITQTTTESSQVCKNETEKTSEKISIPRKVPFKSSIILSHHVRLPFSKPS